MADALMWAEQAREQLSKLRMTRRRKWGKKRKSKRGRQRKGTDWKPLSGPYEPTCLFHWGLPL
jgi:hypothetical protein